MKRITLIFALLVVGAFAAQLVPVLRQSQVVHAQSCKVPGKQIATTDGILVCDCTVSTNTNCNCIVACKGPGELLD